MLVADVACFFFNDTATTEIYTLSLHDALPILRGQNLLHHISAGHQGRARRLLGPDRPALRPTLCPGAGYDGALDRKSTRLNSSHANISYAVFCLKKKKFVPTQFQSPLR